MKYQGPQKPTTRKSINEVFAAPQPRAFPATNPPNIQPTHATESQIVDHEDTGSNPSATVPHQADPHTPDPVANPNAENSYWFRCLYAGGAAGIGGTGQRGGRGGGGVLMVVTRNAGTLSYSLNTGVNGTLVALDTAKL